MREIIINIVKGYLIGSANVIPGVSGGTFALLLNVFERLILAIKAWNPQNIAFLKQKEWKKFLDQTDFFFLIQILTGMVLAVLSLAKLLEFLFRVYPVYVWSFFFGLILASAWFVGREIGRINVKKIVILLIGLAIALFITFLTPASENDNAFYLMLCGAIAIASMILPGISGSFMLLLMGNYQLVAIKAINGWHWHILLPFAAGMGIGIIAFAHFLSWVLKKWRSETMALLTGFIIGSLGMLWPWKKAIYLLNYTGGTITRNGKPVITGYEYLLPQSFNQELIISTLLAIIGLIIIFATEKMANHAE